METTLMRDIRYGARSLLKRPGSTLVALIALAIGIGVNTAIFSVVNDVLLRPLPFRDPERLVSVWERGLGMGIAQNELAPANYFDLRADNRTFEQVGAFGSKSYNLSGDGPPERLEGQLVAANVLSLLGVEPLIGRAFMPEEEQLGQERVVVLSYGLWQRRFGSAGHVLGKQITLDGQPFTVIGVMPRSFFFPEREIELWTPWAMEQEEASGRGDHYLRVVARLKSGSTIEQANSDLQSIAGRLAQEYPRTNHGLDFVATSLHDDYVGDIRQPLLIILAAVALVLLIACANVANLLLAQVISRRKEISIRAALGAKRWLIVRQFLIESLLLATAGGLIGILVAIWGVTLFSKITPEELSIIQGGSLDARILGFTIVVTFITGILFGLLPALHASRAEPGDTLKESARSIFGSQSGLYVRRVLLVSQVALALVLLVGAGVLLRSFHHLRNIDPGFRTENLLTMRMVLPNSKYSTAQSRRTFYDEILRRVQSLPGVEAAGMISFLPLSFSGMNFSFTVEGQQGVDDMNLPGAIYRVVSPDYFRTMAIPMLQGRSFDGHDSADAPAVVVINRRLAEQFWGTTNAVGKRLKIGSADSRNPWATVIGVVGDVRQAGLYEPPRLEMYAPYTQDARGFAAPRDLILRTAADRTALASAVREAVWAVDKDQPVSNVQTMQEVFSAAVSRDRFQTLLLAIFAAVALGLACVGLYGVISYSVAQRTHEIGLRMALGAQQVDVLRLVMNQGLRLTFLGVLFGLAGAFATTRLMSGMVHGVSTTDPFTFGVVPLFVSAIALIACYVPARRASRVDPLVALRYE